MTTKSSDVEQKFWFHVVDESQQFLKCVRTFPAFGLSTIFIHIHHSIDLIVERAHLQNGTLRV